MKKKEIILLLTTKGKTFSAAVFRRFNTLKRAVIGSFLKSSDGRTKNDPKYSYGPAYVLGVGHKNDYLTNTRSKT